MDWSLLVRKALLSAERPSQERPGEHGVNAHTHMDVTNMGDSAKV
jgi:hypothetical protein